MSIVHLTCVLYLAVAEMGMEEIIEFFLEARAYHIVLSRFNGITAVQR